MSETGPETSTEDSEKIKRARNILGILGLEHRANEDIGGGKTALNFLDLCGDHPRAKAMIEMVENGTLPDELLQGVAKSVSTYIDTAQQENLGSSNSA